MRLAVAQIEPKAGDLRHNLSLHERALRAIPEEGESFILFPELSLTGYEPRLASECAISVEESILNDLEALCRVRRITAAVGAPLADKDGVHIGMIVLGGEDRRWYCKRDLHPDELPFFEPGTEGLLLGFGETKIQPAICYESLLPDHASLAEKLGATVFAASVAKHADGMKRALLHYKKVAKEHRMMVLVSNCIGNCDDFQASGGSAILDTSGTVLAQLQASEQGVLFGEVSGGKLESDNVSCVNL